ncbi:MAG: Bro-N domain-containing protein [Bacilli bacterium]|nr:Bro-N domain-containing protein [Bacilli bacterium]
MNNELQLLNKTFENKKVRTVWNSDEEKYYISVIDIVSILTESKDSTAYWRKLKQRLKEEGNETVTNCHALKMLAKDGKNRLTDVVDLEGMFRIIESIPSKKAEPIKLWLASLGKERIDEEYDPEITINRALDTYRRKGYSDDWINQRLKAIDARKEFTDELKNNGVESSKDFADLTNLLTKTWSGYSVKEYKSYKRLTKENLRDNMTNMELVLNMLAEVSSTEISKSSDVKSKENAKESVIEGSTIAKNTREQIEAKTGKKIVTNINNKNLKQIKD